MAHMLSKDLKEAVLEYALLGKLTSQSSDEKVNEIVCQANERFKKSKLKNKVENLLTDELDELPVNWQWIQLGKVADIVRGLTFSTAFKEPVNNTTLVLRGGNIDSSTEKINFIDNIFVDSSIIKTEQYIKRDDTLIVASSGTKSSVGKSTLITEDYSNVSFGGFMMVVRPIGYLHPKLLSWHIKRYRQKIISNTVGYISNITLPILANLAIPLPPLEEQQRIVDKVEELISKIDEYEKIENQLVELKKEFPGDMKAAILQAAMEGKLTKGLECDTKLNCKLVSEISNDDIPYDIPDRWGWTTLAKLIKDDEIGDGDWVLSNDMCNDSNNNLIQIGSIGDGVYIKKNFKHVSDKFFENKKCSELFKDDILISRFISKDHMNVCILPELPGRLFTSVDVCWVRNNPLRYSNAWLMWCLLCQGTQRQVMSYTAGTTRQRISKTNLMKVYIPLPPIEEQQRIVELLDKLLPLCEELI